VSLGLIKKLTQNLKNEEKVELVEWLNDQAEYHLVMEGLMTGHAPFSKDGGLNTGHSPLSSSKHCQTCTC
jgi:hypothetical protein